MDPDTDRRINNLGHHRGGLLMGMSMQQRDNQSLRNAGILCGSNRGDKRRVSLFKDAPLFSGHCSRSGNGEYIHVTFPFDVQVTPDVDRRIGAVEAKQRARDARCRACLDRLRREVALARSVRLWAAVATVLALACAALALVLVG